MGIKKSNRIFYLIQVVVWGGISLISSLVIKVFSTEFILYSAVASTFIGVFTTSLLRWYIKKYVSLHSITAKEIVKIFVSTLLTTALYAIFSILFGFITAKFFGDEIFASEVEFMTKFDHPLLLALNSLFIIFN